MCPESEVEAQWIRGETTNTSKEETEENNDQSSGDKETGSASYLEALYNDDLGEEIPLDQGVYAPPYPEDLIGIDFSDSANFRSIIEEAEAKTM